MVGTIDSAVEKGRTLAGEGHSEEDEQEEAAEDASAEAREEEPEPAGVS
jgi:hypothetical protein